MLALGARRIRLGRINTTLKKPAVKFFIFVVALDLLILILKSYHYYFYMLVGIGYGFLFPAILTLISFFLLANSLKIKTYIVLLVSIFGILFILGIWLVYLAADFSVNRITSPTSEEALIIEHRDVSLGETRHIYNFYRPTLLPGILKKLNNEPVSFSIHYYRENPDALKALGVSNAKWTEDGVIFYTEHGEIEVDYQR